MVSKDLNDEQRALVVEVKQLGAVVHMAGLSATGVYACSVIRSRLVVTAVTARMGWADFCVASSIRTYVTSIFKLLQLKPLTGLSNKLVRGRPFTEY